jgi:hypothetical protein
MKPILFFALKDDILAVLASVEGARRLKYAKAGLFTTQHLQYLSSGSEIPNLGIADTDSSIACETYLIAGELVELNARPIKQTDGTVQYGVDQLFNPDTVMFTAGGAYGEDVILHGRIATASDSPRSQELMKLFSAAFRKHFKKVKSYWVGANAQSWLGAGARLTAAAASPREYDLVI